MKMLTAMLMLILSLSSFASSQTRTFFFDGSQTSTSLDLFAEKTHIEYRYEQRLGICYRTEVYYERICYGGPQPRCESRPVHRQVPYSCWQTVSIPYEVKDYDVQANVNLDITALPEATHGETFSVTLNGDQLSISALSSGKKYFVILDNQQVSSDFQGSVKYIDATYNVSFVEASPVLAALSVKNISVKNPILNFSLGPVANQSAVGYSLHVEKAPIVGSDTVLFDRELNLNELTLTEAAAGTLAQVDLNRLGVELTSGRYTLTAKVFFKHRGSLINAPQFEATSASRTLIYKIR